MTNCYQHLARHAVQTRVTRTSTTSRAYLHKLACPAHRATKQRMLDIAGVDQATAGPHKWKSARLTQVGCQVTSAPQVLSGKVCWRRELRHAFRLAAQQGVDASHVCNQPQPQTQLIIAAAAATCWVRQMFAMKWLNLCCSSNIQSAW